jgi:hypothetical protein
LGDEGWPVQGSPASLKVKKMSIPWSPAEDQQLRKLALSGQSLAQIAAQMQRGKSSVRTRALKLEIAIAHDRNPMRETQKPKASK